MAFTAGHDAVATAFTTDHYYGLRHSHCYGLYCQPLQWLLPWPLLPAITTAFAMAITTAITMAISDIRIPMCRNFQSIISSWILIRP